ncbi:osmoprotectant ABC transporter substrate-binding protein [Carnobacterium gallinarum]|uniref:osmoprotectant ABC transporter substrate-binding protein n=1 Tax=Carnobacterium gallinarum TaxID=2749 RepID=UPI00055840FF|nr:osmoprotectant ABC transporter substrate-binding protein [Carnobacterium gallinarum]
MVKKNIFRIVIVLIVLVVGFFSYDTFSGKEEAIKVAGGVTSESQILASLVSEMIEHETSNKVTLLNNLGSANIMHKAMLKGDVDITSTRYTGTDLIGTLNLPLEKDPDKALEIVQQEFKKRYEQVWFPSYGFENQFTFMVTKETAEKYQLKKVSDLKNVAPELTLGVDPTWYKREGDGYPAFVETYGTKFKRVFPMQIGLVYDAVSAGELDVVLGYSTDGRVGSYNLTMLEDDLQFFPPYSASLVVSEKTLKAHPELKKILGRLEETIDTKTMQKLNFEADNDLTEPSVVAKKFLEEHDYFRE